MSKVTVEGDLCHVYADITREEWERDVPEWVKERETWEEFHERTTVPMDFDRIPLPLCEYERR